MKRLMSILLGLVFCLMLSSCADMDNGKGVVLVEKDSFFSDFSIEDNEVKLYCHIVVNNQFGTKKFARFQGDFKNDVRGGLVVDQILTAYDPEDPNISQFVLQPGINSIDIVFVGEHGCSNVKQNRLLPPIYVVLMDE